MREEILSLLRCPVSGLPLVLEAREEQGGHVIAGALRTADGRFEYPIRDGVPVLLPSPGTGRRTRSAFDLQWARRVEGLERPHVLYGFSLDAGTKFMERTVLEPEDRGDRWVLDAGCGTAERSVALARRGHRVIAFDLSNAVHVAFGRFREIPNLHLLQADVLNPPIAPESMDVLLSIGVLHHTPDARRGFHRLAALQRAGGRILVWLYPAARADTDPFLGKLYLMRDNLRVTGRLPVSVVWGLSTAAAAALYPFFSGRFRRLRDDDEVSSREIWGAILMNTFDFLSPPYQSRHAPDEVARWFNEEGYEPPERAGTGFYVARRTGPPVAVTPAAVGSSLPRVRGAVPEVDAREILP